ncbi:hypothetical protein LEP1GSC035_2638 [Leptospira noguchii str. 2007001578]|uniref:Transposase domain protein n=1 Tax=Leptospira noguchii str. 2007001578 TaxID=1049974 RepID=A0ABP2TC08_9LEPT|nr:hypothetical protein LEP1GSC035_2638 [Leptospira noguchii str. 2007001578]
MIVLNPGDLATIYQSLKKTDKEDSLKIARLIQRFPIEELPVVPIPKTRPEKLSECLSKDRHSGKRCALVSPMKRRIIVDFVANKRTGQDN